jgi:hypothetical protein
MRNMTPTAAECNPNAGQDCPEPPPIVCNPNDVNCGTPEPTTCDPSNAGNPNASCETLPACSDNECFVELECPSDSTNPNCYESVATESFAFNAPATPASVGGSVMLVVSVLAAVLGGCG